MTNILVSGLINLETTLRVDGFPLEYQPVRYPFFGVNSTVSGVGFNIAKALATLGDDVHLLSLIGSDSAAELVRSALAQIEVSDAHVLSQLADTPQSVILYESSGRRAINTDLKDIQEQVYPPDLVDAALAQCSLAVLANINFSRPILARARAAGKLVATDVHVISNLEDDYNRDFMAAANILFMSDERLPCSPEDWARQVQHRYGTDIIVIGLGAQGALLAVRMDNFIERIPAVYTRDVMNTVGAGDSLFSAFVHSYSKTGSPYEAIRRAVIFASYKIGASGGASGFLDDDALESLYRQLTT
jgi:acarbose 7IV-phosphotransferase